MSIDATWRVHAHFCRKSFFYVGLASHRVMKAKFFTTYRLIFISFSISIIPPSKSIYLAKFYTGNEYAVNEVGFSAIHTIVQCK